MEQLLLIQGIAVVNKSAGLAAGEVSHSDRLSFFSNKACELKVGSRSEILGRLLVWIPSFRLRPPDDRPAPPRPASACRSARPTIFFLFFYSCLLRCHNMVRRHVFLFRNTPYVIVKLCYNYSFSFTRRQTFFMAATLYRGFEVRDQPGSIILCRRP